MILKSLTKKRDYPAREYETIWDVPVSVKIDLIKYWHTHKENGSRQIGIIYGLTPHQVNKILGAYLKDGCVTVASKMNVQ